MVRKTKSADGTSNTNGCCIPPQQAVLSEAALRHNVNVLEFGRTVQAATSGCAAGVLGLTGFHGFGFYLLCAALQSLIWRVQAGTSWQRYFLAKTPLFTHGLMNGLFTYVLLWTFLYGMVHVY